MRLIIQDFRKSPKAVTLNKICCKSNRLILFDESKV